MGNRVLIQFIGTGSNGDREFSPVIYGHWAGSKAAGSLVVLRKRMSDRPGDISYVAARCVGLLIGDDDGSTGYGLWNATKILTAADSHGDAGIFLVDIGVGPVWRVAVIDGHPSETGSLVDTDNVRFTRSDRGLDHV